MVLLWVLCIYELYLVCSDAIVCFYFYIDSFYQHLVEDPVSLEHVWLRE